MWLPVISGVIERRLLINFRADPDVVAWLLPPPFKPQIVSGYGMVGICLIRLSQVRPRGMPSWTGLCSENAAHRIAVEWDDGGQRRTGVYILRRDTNSRLNALAGGRVFPGVHHRARFEVHETFNHFEVRAYDKRGGALLHVRAQAADGWPDDSVFCSLNNASEFFEAGSLGYSPGRRPQRFQGLELRCENWQIAPLSITSATSSLFGDEQLFPRGSIQLDCGLLMRRVEHEWHSQGELHYAAADSAISVVKDSTISA